MIQPLSAADKSETKPYPIWTNLRSQLIWAYEGIPAVKLHQSNHSIGTWLWFMRSGSVTVSCDGLTLTARAGQWMATPKRYILQEFSEDAAIYSIHFYCLWPTGENLFYEGDGQVFDDAAFPQMGETAKALIDQVQLIVPGAKTYFDGQSVTLPAQFALQCAFMRFLGVYTETMLKLGVPYTQSSRIDNRLTRAISCMNHTPFSDQLPYAQLNRETGLSRSQLDRLFRSSLECSVRGYWERRRLDAARALLVASTSPLKEIGYRLGFKQPSHFSKWFQQATGRSPSAYREDGKDSP